MAGRTSARLILFFISSHRHTRKGLVVSASYIFHARQPQAQKSKAQCHHPGIREIPESLTFITKIICEHKQMWSTNMSFNWEGRWAHQSQDSSKKGLWKTKHPQWPRLCICAASTGTQALGLEPTRFKEIITVASVRHTDTPIHRFKLYWVSGGGGGGVYALHHHCGVLSSAVSLIALGTRPLPPWHKCNEIGKTRVKTQHLQWNKHSKHRGSEQQSFPPVKGWFLSSRWNFRNPLVKHVTSDLNMMCENIFLLTRICTKAL